MDLFGSKSRMGGQVCDVTPVISLIAYTTGDQLGSIMELQAALAMEAGVGFLDSVCVIDLDNQKIAMDIMIFSELPTLVSVDNGLIDLSSANLLKCLGVVSVATGDYVTAKASTNAVATIRNLKLHVKNTTAAPGSTSLWAVAVIRGTPLYTTVSSLKFRFGIA